MNPLPSHRTSKARVDCFPDAPADWERCAISAVAEINPLYRVNTAEQHPFLDMASLRENFGGIVGYDSRPFDSSYSRFQKGDTLFAKITPCAENGKVACVESVPAEIGLGSTEFIVLSPRAGFDPYFVYSLASCPAVHRRAVSRMEGSTGRLRITEKTFTKWLWVAVPPDPAEQTRIAETLKAADDHIRAIEEQILKAERVKKALLQSLFVDGLPGIQQKRVESKLGRMPAHWAVQRIGRTFREPPFTGVSPESRPNPPGIPILNVGCVSEGLCTLANISYVDVDTETILANAAKKGDFFVLRGNGNRDYVGTGGWLRDDPPENCIFSDKLIRLRFDQERVADGFFPYLWQSRAFQTRLQSKAQSSSGLWMMNKRDISREWVALPPKREQEKMVIILDAASEQLASLKSQLTAARRVKQSLLQNLLTGKIRLKTRPHV
jgi:type I restriction enzyme S subunit